ncbi:MAG: hypothetical protein ACRDF4_06120 [Rhabdochlamydiaceae bacterium]
MPGTYKETLPFNELSMRAVELKKQGYDRFAFQPFGANKKYAVLKAWKFRARPDKRKKALGELTDAEMLA